MLVLLPLVIFVILIIVGIALIVYLIKLLRETNFIGAIIATILMVGFLVLITITIGIPTFKYLATKSTLIAQAWDWANQKTGIIFDKDSSKVPTSTDPTNSSSYTLPGTISQEKQTIIHNEMVETFKLICATQDTVLFINETCYKLNLYEPGIIGAFHSKKIPAYERLKAGQYNSEEDFLKDFNTVYVKQSEYTEMSRVDINYGLCDLKESYSVEEDGNINCTIKMATDDKNFSVLIDGETMTSCIAYDDVEENAKINIPLKIIDTLNKYLLDGKLKVFKDISRLFKKIEHFNSMFKYASDQFGAEEVKMIKLIQKMCQEALDSTKKRELLEALAKCKHFNDLYNVTINEVYLKKDGKVIQDFSDEDVIQAFGKPEKQKFDTEKDQIGENLYREMNMVLFYKDKDTKNAPIYQTLPNSKAQKYTGRNPFNTYAAIREKIDEN